MLITYSLSSVVSIIVMPLLIVLLKLNLLYFVVMYQLEMMKNLRYVNVDHLHVGWYQSTNFGTYMNKALVDSQFNYQFSIDESIVLVYGIDFSLEN